MFFSLPTIKIEGQEYPLEMAYSPTSTIPSKLQMHYKELYGSESFHFSLATFLAEWLNNENTLCVHTSGSTGKPKELWVEKQRMVNSAQATITFLGLKKNDTALLCMPLAYIAGKMVVVRALIGGLNLQLVTPCGHPLAQVDKIPEFAALTPMQVYNTLGVTKECQRLKEVKHLIIGGGAVDRDMAATLKLFPHAVWSTYGMTETLSHIALRRLSGENASEWYTPFENVKVSISPENTLVIHAPNVCPELLTTNDIVDFNKQGQFRIIGRKDNTINTGGIKVQIEEIENTLRQIMNIPFLITSAPDPKFGEHIVLLVERNEQDSASNDLEQKIQRAINTLPTYWRPKSVVKVPKLPLTETGKPDRATAKRLAVGRTL